MKRIDFEEAAKELKCLVDDADADQLADLYEYAFGAVKSCYQSIHGEYFEVEYHEGLEPNA